LYRPLDADRREALNGFLAGIERRAFRMALVACGDREDAHEIVQDAMLALVRRYAGRPDDEWPLLFHRILQNGIRDWHRRAKVRARLFRWFGADDGQSRDPVEGLPDRREPGPYHHYASDELIERLEACIGALPLRQQQAFLLRAWEGLDVRDTARSMGCSQGSVKTHFSRAVRALRSQLGELVG
jgi:RNA polymerase sigma-70 factor (ECF subfamily)